MGLLQNLLLISGLLSARILMPWPAVAQSADSCSKNSSALPVKPDVILDCLRAGKPVYYESVTVEGDLDLTRLNGELQPRVDIPVALVIRNSHFTGSLISFSGDHGYVLRFQEQVDLRGSHFDGSVDFTAATFEKFVHFENIRLESGANFTQAAFQNGASFHNTIFNDSSSFLLANVSGGIDFSETLFVNQANFSGLHSTQSTDPLFQAAILFSGAQFTGEVFFMGAAFESPVLLNDATFKRRSPEDAVLFTDGTYTTLDLTNASFESGQLELRNLYYEKLIMPNFHPSILAAQNPVEGLALLKDNFREQGNLNIANEIAYWQNGIQRKGKPIGVQILETVFLDWTFGYGFKPARSFMTSGFLILFFAIFYYPAGTLRPMMFAPSKPRERKYTIRLSEIPIADDESNETASGIQRSLPLLPVEITQAWKAVAFSFGVFTKLSSGKFVAVRLGSVVITEWVVGLMMMAGFLFSLANTNPLLRSILDLLK